MTAVHGINAEFRVAAAHIAHTGDKYVRRIHHRSSALSMEIDVYNVLEAFSVTCPARQHAIKKLLCAGLRGKGSQIDDLIEARDAISRAIELQRTREADRSTNEA